MSVDDLPVHASLPDGVAAASAPANPFAQAFHRLARGQRVFPTAPSGGAMTQEAKSAAPLSAQSLFEVIEHSDWLIPSRPGRPDLFSWRTALALALRNVPLAPLVVELWPVLEQMADQVTERLNAAVADGSLLQVGFADWLALWREQFSHWHDPVRALVCQYCPNSDVARLTGHSPCSMVQLSPISCWRR
jgi:hypothetical protein